MSIYSKYIPGYVRDCFSTQLTASLACWWCHSKESQPLRREQNCSAVSYYWQPHLFHPHSRASFNARCCHPHGITRPLAGLVEPLARCQNCSAKQQDLCSAMRLPIITRCCEASQEPLLGDKNCSALEGAYKPTSGSHFDHKTTQKFMLLCLLHTGRSSTFPIVSIHMPL